MTDREHQFQKLGFEYAEGIELSNKIILNNGREIRKTKDNQWECQPYNDNYWQTFDDLINAIKFAKGI